MITSAFLWLVYGLAWAITSPLRLLADVSVETGFGSAIATAGEYLSTVNNFLPIDTLGAVLLLWVGIETVLGAYKIIMWVIRRIPTQS